MLLYRHRSTAPILLKSIILATSEKPLSPFSMDFHSFARRDLQFLCKKNGVPANLTNAAMAKALEALETVEGIEEIQEALGVHSPKINSPELPHSSRRTFSRRVTHGDEPKIQQQQEPSQLSRSHRISVKTLEVTEMASKEDEIQETLIFQSPAVKSPELPRMGRRTSARRAALGEEPKIQQLKPSPLTKSCRAASNDLEVTDMAYKKVEGRKKEVPQILPKTPATRKDAKGVEAQSSRRRAKKNEEVVSHTDTPKAVEAKGGKTTGVVTRRSTRLSSRKALEESVNTESKSRSIGRENSAVKMEALAKEDTNEQEKEEGKTDLVEYGDSCAVIVEEKDQGAESHKISSYINEDDSNGEVDNECEGIQEDVPRNHQQQSSPRPRSSQVTTKVLEATKMVSKKENDKKAPKLLPTTRRSTRLSSKKPAEEKNSEKGTDKMAALTEEDAEKQEKVEEKKDFAVKSDSCVAAPAEEDEEKKKKEESHVAWLQGYSSSIEFENDDSIVALVEEVENNDQEKESPGFSSSTQGEGSNFEGENRDSTVVHVKVDGKKDQELEIQAFSSSIERTNSNVEQKNFSNVLVEDEGQKDQEESHDLSSFFGENSKDEPFESTEESSDQPPVNEYVKDSSDQLAENEYLEVYQSPKNKAVGYCSDQSPENDLVEDSANQGSKFVEVSGNLLTTNEAAEDSGDHSSDAKLATSAISGNLICGEIPPLLHKEAISYIQQSSGIEEEAEKLSLLFTKMTLKEIEDCGDALLEPVLAQDISFISTKLSATMVLHQHADLVTTADIVFPKANYTSLDLPPGLVIPSLFSDVEATTNLLGNEITTEAIGETPEVKESEGVITNEIPAAIEELIDDNLSAAWELTTNDSVNVHSTSFEPRTLVSSTELCTEDHLRKLVANESFDVPQKREISRRGSFELHSPVSCGEFWSELSTVDSAFEFKEAFGDLPTEISAEIDDLSNSDELSSSEKSVNAETSQPQIPVNSTNELCVEFSGEPVATMSSPLKLPCQSEIMSLVESSSIVQNQSSEEAGMAATEIAEEKEQAANAKALDEEVFLKDGNLKLLSLTKLRAMYKQMLNGTKTEQEKQTSITEQDFERLSCIKHDENCKQKLNDDTIKSERKKSLIKQEDLECLSRSKLDSSSKLKLNEDTIKQERKRTPLKNLNYSTF